MREALTLTRLHFASRAAPSAAPWQGPRVRSRPAGPRQEGLQRRTCARVGGSVLVRVPGRLFRVQLSLAAVGVLLEQRNCRRFTLHMRET